jgi:hypothetical protein
MIFNFCKVLDWIVLGTTSATAGVRGNGGGIMVKRAIMVNLAKIVNHKMCQAFPEIDAGNVVAPEPNRAFRAKTLARLGAREPPAPVKLKFEHEHDYEQEEEITHLRIMIRQFVP